MKASRLQNVLEQHKSVITVLETHASLLLDSMGQNIAIEVETLRLLQYRLQKTEDLISFFKESSAALDAFTNRTVNGMPQPQSPASSPNTAQSPRPARAAEPTVDASGLFSVDTNPTPLERLYQSRTTGREALGQESKRKASDLDIPLETLDFLDHQHNNKRTRNRGDDDIDIPEVDDSFEREVEARLKSKEERKRSQDNKKRKRESDTSPTTTPANVKGAKTKRQRRQTGRKQEKKQLKPLGQKNKTQQKPVEVRQKHVNKRSNTEAMNGGTPPNKKRKRSR